MFSRDPALLAGNIARFAAAAAILIGSAWLLFWFTGIAPRWSADGVITVKTNMAFGQVLAGTALLFLAPLVRGRRKQRVGLAAATAVFLIGTLTLSQHLFDYNLGIDQLLASEPTGAAATISPNRIGVPGSLSLLLLGAGLLLLPSRHARFAPWLSVTVCIVNLIPAVGFLYGIHEFYSEARFTGIAWSTVVALLSLGMGLFLARPAQAPIAQLLRDDPGGALLRRLLPAVVFIPLVLGFLRVQGEQRGLYDTAVGTGTLTIIIVLGFVYILWRTAGSFSQTAAARAESELRIRTLFESMSDSEKRYRNLFESIDEGFCILEVLFDADGRPNDWRYLEVNPAFERHNGLERATGKRILELVPNIEAHWFDVYGKVAATSESIRFEEFSAALHRWFDVFAFRVGEPAEHKIAVLLNDITGRKRAEEALRAGEARFRALVTATSEVMYRMSPDWSEMEQLEGGHFIADTKRPSRGWLQDYIHPDDQPHVTAAIKEAIQARKIFELEHRVRRVDGTLGWTFSRAVPLLDGENNIVEWFGSASDITERKRAEQEQKRLAQQLQLALDAARLGWWHYDPKTNVLTWDERYKQVTGVSDDARHHEEVLAQLHSEDLPPVLAAVQAALNPRDPKPYSAEYRIVQDKRSVRWVESHGIALFEGEGNDRRPVSLVGTVQDITERKQFQQELERLVAERTAKLQEVIGELEHFTYTITHDMRAPLRSMRGFAELLKEICGGCREQESHEFLGRIIRSADRMDGLITDALTYSKAARHDLVLQPVDAGALLQEMLDSYPELQPSRAQIEIQGRIPFVLANEAGLTQCFSNLLSNAVKFVKAGDRPRVVIRAEQRDAWVRLWFEDNGIGIPEEMLTRVFDMFSRGHENYDGTGIGLALVQKVVGRLGGKVGVESAPGNGSRFWLELRPAAEAVA